ncbi:polysaccharide deacetylase family protein [Moheibacter sediminis]|uniref:Polysaccharide deacetylase n=1 Tax=Moheibacter sediminis TaxID=1434700 RepID=A0A1W1YGH0_9FLAO|nr:polysaccharide deacetylase family protein [Moheibacter sediminis]SMC35267.1 Polysaccharide deacetylase [Moheibacter sediminis]
MHRFLSPKNIIFPFYHTISDENCPHIKNLYPLKTISQFEKELDYFQKNYQSISLEEIKIHIESGTQADKPSFFLSFDDGLAGCYSIIAPILKKRNISAAFFINTGFIDNQDLFYRYKVSLIIEKTAMSKGDLLNLTIHDLPKIDEIAKEANLDFNQFLQQEKPYMNWDEVKDLSAQGFYIGGHSVNHPYYNQISFDEQLFQTRSSIDTIISKLSLDYKIFSFPFTDLGVKKEFFETVYREEIADLTFGTAGIKTDEFQRNLQRIPMDNCFGSPQRFIRKNLIQYHLKKLMNKDKVIHPL